MMLSGAKTYATMGLLERASTGASGMRITSVASGLYSLIEDPILDPDLPQSNLPFDERNQ